MASGTPNRGSPTARVAPVVGQQSAHTGKVAEALREVSPPNQCSGDQWRIFGAGLANTMGAPVLSNAFIADFPWKNVYLALCAMRAEDRTQFLIWFWNVVFLEVGHQVGACLAEWMNQGIFPDPQGTPTAEITTRRRSSADLSIVQFGKAVGDAYALGHRELAKEVPDGVFLRSGAKRSPEWDDALWAYDRADWTIPNNAMSILIGAELSTLRTTWEYAWTVVRALVEYIVVDALKKYKDRFAKRDQGTLLTYAAGVHDGYALGKVEENTKWALQGYLGGLMASALRDIAQHREPFPNPAQALVEACREGYWILGPVGHNFWLFELPPWSTEGEFPE